MADPPAAQQPASPARSAAPSVDALRAASDALGVAAVKTITFTGFGANFPVGQSPNPNEPWPRVTINNYEALVDYERPAMQIDMLREQGAIQQRGGGQPFIGEQRQQQFVSAGTAWNVAFAAPPPAAGRGAAPPADGAAQGRGRGNALVAQAPQPAPGAAADRLQQISVTPHGFLRAAVANNAAVKRGASGTEVTFTANGRNFVGVINAGNQLERVQTWVDSPVLGDMLVETVYSNYQKVDGGVSFPMRIVQRSGGHPSLDLWISSVQPNAMVNIEVPDAVKSASPPAPPVVEAQKLAEGVYWLTGGSHHSVAIEMRDHAIVVEGPQNQDRSLAVIAKVKETIPNKPIRFVVNTHHHFDHSGGLRPFVDEGATVVTHQMNRAFFEKAWAAPRTLNPDRLSQSQKTAMFQTVTDRAVLTDGARTVEMHRIANNPHNDGFLMVYLPAEKILIEADAYTPAAPAVAPTAGAAPQGGGNAMATPPVPTISPTTLNLYQNIQRLKLDVVKIAALHGPRVATMQDLATAAGRQS
jgi:glyoxylase-like metal-dependent hydrolase (beta-lactamase superfamily II)